jgi:hemerythrin-like domain-containing protein
MTTATQILRQEHEGILRMLEVAERVASQLERGERVPRETLANLLEFFQTFADKCHHAKEEGLLFPALEAKGILKSGGPIGIMLSEHTKGRALIQTLAELTSAYASDPRGAGQRWAQAARSYVYLLRGHIDKENNVLFKIAEGVLRPSEQTELSEQFEKLEVEKIGAGTHERLHGMISEMTMKKAA